MVKIGKFGEVASNYFDCSDSFVNIAYGAVRSGKTIVVTFSSQNMCFVPSTTNS